jgi:hypothetical protein
MGCVVSRGSVVVEDAQRRTYSGEIAIQDAEDDDAGHRVHADHPKEEDGTTKRGDDHHGRDAEVSDEDRRAELADEARGIHDHELESRRRLRFEQAGTVK